MAGRIGRKSFGVAHAHFGSGGPGVSSGPSTLQLPAGQTLAPTGLGMLKVLNIKLSNEWMHYYHLF